MSKQKNISIQADIHKLLKDFHPLYIAQTKEVCRFTDLIAVVVIAGIDALKKEN